MTTPIVTELPLKLERVMADSFGSVAAAPSRADVSDQVMNYIECDLGAGVTLQQRRHARVGATPRSRRGVWATLGRRVAMAA